jgi:hypothetical protein
MGGQVAELALNDKLSVQVYQFPRT